MLSIAAAVAVAGLPVVGVAPAQAFDRSFFEAPFRCGEVWNGATRSVADGGHPTGSGSFYALDFNWGTGAADLGRPVLASAAGTVQSVGGSLGTLVLSHPGGWETRYLHMRSFAGLSAGSTVAQGQIIGEVGAVGADSPHLHYEQRLNGILQPIYLHNAAAPYSYTYNGPAFTSYNCGGGTTPVPPTSNHYTNVLGRFDYSGDSRADLLAIAPDGGLYMYRGNGAGGFATGNGELVNSGWAGFQQVIAPGDFNGDGTSDLLAVQTDGTLLLYGGTGTGGWSSPQAIGSGWQNFRTVFAPGDFDGDGKSDVMAVTTDGSMVLYAGNGHGGWLNASGVVIGSGFGAFTSVFGPGDFDGDAAADVMTVSPDGTLTLFSGNGHGRWLTGNGQPIGSGFDAFVNVFSVGGDFSGDGLPDILTVGKDGALWLYAGNGHGTWLTGSGYAIGSGF